MRKTIFISTILLVNTVCAAQKLALQIDSIHPIIKNDSHGDSIRKYFSTTFYSYPAPVYYARIKNYKTELKEPYLLMVVYYSNKLAVNYSFANNKIPALKEYTNDTSYLVQHSYADYGGKYAIPIFDSSGIIVTVNGINHENADKYEFQVVENKTKVIVPWTKPTLFSKWYMYSKIADKNKQDTEVAYLGQFKNEFGKALSFQVRKIDQPNLIQVSMSALWVNRTPNVLGVFTFSQLANFLEIFKKQWIPEKSMARMVDWSSDSTLLKLKNKFQPNENSLIFYLDDIVISKDIIEYNLVYENDSTGWRANDFDLNFIWLKNLEHGNYNLKIRYSVQRQNVFNYLFTIQAAWYQTWWFKFAAAVVSAVVVGFVILLIKSKRQAQKLISENIQKQLVQTELKSIRSQFNPHFVFNALNSIQGLITKNDPEKANKYLTEFSTLMRDSLKESNNEFVSISKEIKMLKSYLNLEQLRFGFTYQIKVEKKIDINAMEIPSLLLQPLVENAVKHGIATLYENGILIVSFEKTASDMIVKVIDNGKGFAENNNNDGFGLKLTKERIQLLNKTLNQQQIEFSANRLNETTQIIIHFKNWLI